MGQVLASPKRATGRSVHGDSAVSMQCLKHHHHFGACKCHQFGTVISNGFHKADCNAQPPNAFPLPAASPSRQPEQCSLLPPELALARSLPRREPSSPTTADCARTRVPHSASYAGATDLNGNVTAAEPTAAPLSTSGSSYRLADRTRPTAVSSISQSHTFPSNALPLGVQRPDVPQAAIAGSRSMTFENRPSRADSGIASLTSVLSKRLSFLNLRKSRERQEKHRSLVETSTSVRDLQAASRPSRHSVYCNPTSTSLASLDPPSCASATQNGVGVGVGAGAASDSVPLNHDAERAASAKRAADASRTHAPRSNGRSIIQNIYFWRYSASSHRLATAAGPEGTQQTLATAADNADRLPAAPHGGITHQYKQVIPKSKSCYNIKHANAGVDGLQPANELSGQLSEQPRTQATAADGALASHADAPDADAAPRRTVLQASTSELLKCLSEFLIRRCKRISTLKANDPVCWMRAIDKRLILQGWADITFVNPANVVFVYLLLRDIVSDETRSVRELQHLIFTSLYLAYAYMGNEISYPLKPFLLPDDDRDRFWERCLAIIKLKSSDMLRINAEPSYFAEVFAELKCYSVFV